MEARDRFLVGLVLSEHETEGREGGGEQTMPGIQCNWSPVGRWKLDEKEAGGHAAARSCVSGW